MNLIQSSAICKRELGRFKAFLKVLKMLCVQPKFTKIGQNAKHPITEKNRIAYENKSWTIGIMRFDSFILYTITCINNYCVAATW